MPGSPKKRAKRLGLDPLDQRYGQTSVAPARPSLEMEPAKDGGRARLSEVNRERVMQALLDGYPQAAIAKALGISTPTLKRLMADDRQMMEAVEAQRSFEEAELRDILMELARKGDTVAAIFLAKARHGWRDREDLKKEPEKGGGVLLVPAPMDLDTWCAAAAAQQAQFRERNPDADALTARPGNTRSPHPSRSA